MVNELIKSYKKNVGPHQVSIVSTNFCMTFVFKFLNLKKKNT